MPRRHGHRAQRRRFFVACEGDSEVGYAAFVQRLADESDLAVHLDIRKCRGGDPLAIVETAVRELQARKSRRGPYVGQTIFLDADRRDDRPDRTVQADRLLREHGLHTIWSRLVFEAFLLIHFDGCEQLRPATSVLAMQQLRRCWPAYIKGMVASDVRAVLDLPRVVQAAQVVPEFRTFLVAIGLLI